jgi:hypothetical protein
MKTALINSKLVGFQKAIKKAGGSIDYIDSAAAAFRKGGGKVFSYLQINTQIQ